MVAVALQVLPSLTVLQALDIVRSMVAVVLQALQSLTA